MGGQTIHLARVRLNRCGLVNVVRIIRLSYNIRYFLTRWDTVSFSKSIVANQTERVRMENIFAVAYSTATNMTVNNKQCSIQYCYQHDSKQQTV